MRRYLVAVPFVLASSFSLASDWSSLNTTKSKPLIDFVKKSAEYQGVKLNEIESIQEQKLKNGSIKYKVDSVVTYVGQDATDTNVKAEYTSCDTVVLVDKVGVKSVESWNKGGCLAVYTD